MKGREIPGAQAFEAAHYVVGIDELSGDCAEQVDREWNSTLPRGFACFRQAEGAESAIRFSHETMCDEGPVKEVPGDHALWIDARRDRGDRAGRIECRDLATPVAHEAVCVPVRVTVKARDRPDRIQTGLLADVGEDRAGRVE